MQNLSLGQSLTDTDTLHRMSLKNLAVEVGGTSFDESDYNLNGRTINKESTNLEVMQQSLPVGNSKGRSSEGFSESSYSTSEPSGSWGDFEGFEESVGESERFSHNLEILVKSTKTSGVDRDLSSGHCSANTDHVCSEPSLHSVIQEASSSPNEVCFNSKPKTRNVCVTAFCISRFISECLLYKEYVVQGAKLSSYFAANSSGRKATSLQCLTNT